MSQIPKTQADLNEDYDSQIRLLKVLAEQYDKGEIIVGKAIATSIRVLVHDTRASQSLLGQLNLKSRNFFDTSTAVPPDEIGFQRVGSFCGLVGFGGKVNGEAGYIPYLDDTPGPVHGFVSFQDYWDRVVFIDRNHNSFTRKEIVLAVANQDGGAHVDPNIEEKYKQLSRQNSLGWAARTGDQLWENPKGAELAAVRQIAHEIIRTLEPEYQRRKMISGPHSFVLGGMGLLLGRAQDSIGKVVHSFVQPAKKVERNERCPCGSGLKYKRCHGR